MDKICWDVLFGQSSIQFKKKIKAFMSQGLDYDVGMSHYIVLGYIKLNQPCIVTDISHFMETTLSAITSLLNKLVELDLVVRDRTEEDRRIVKVSLTPQGEEVIQILSENRKKLMERMMQGLTEQEINQFFRIHNLMIENFMKDIK